MAQWVLADIPKGLGWIPRIHTVDKNQLLQVSSGLHMFSCAPTVLCPCSHAPACHCTCKSFLTPNFLLTRSTFTSPRSSGLISHSNSSQSVFTTASVPALIHLPASHYPWSLFTTKVQSAAVHMTVRLSPSLGMFS